MLNLNKDFLKKIENVMESLEDLISLAETFEEKDTLDRAEQAAAALEDLSTHIEDGIRVCGNCGDLMNEGYIYEAAYLYYCSDKCLHDCMNENEIAELQKDEDDLELYWTNWEV